MLNENNTLLAIAQRLNMKYPTIYRRFRQLEIEPESVIGATMFLSDADVKRIEQYDRKPGGQPRKAV